MENNPNQSVSSSQSSFPSESSPTYIQKQKNIFMIALGVLMLLFVVAGVSYYLGTQMPAGIQQNTQITTSPPHNIVKKEKLTEVKKYYNRKFGFSLSYPASWKQTIRSGNVRFDENKPIGNSIEIGIFQKNGDLTAREIIENGFYSYLNDSLGTKNVWLSKLKTTEIKIGDKSATRIEGLQQISGPYGPGLWTSHKSNGILIISINPSREGDKVFDEMIKSLKFDDETTIEHLNKYTNKKYDFFVEYPKEYSVKENSEGSCLTLTKNSIRISIGDKKNYDCFPTGVGKVDTEHTINHYLLKINGSNYLVRDVRLKISTSDDVWGALSKDKLYWTDVNGNVSLFFSIPYIEYSQNIDEIRQIISSLNFSE